MKLNTDVLIVGAGITGCSVARELSRYDCSVTVIDRENDIAEGATKANSGIVHAGYDAVSGSRKAVYNVAGAALFPDLCESLGVPYRRTGAFVIAFTDDEKSTLVKLMDRGIKNGVKGLRLLSREEALRLEPNLNPDVVAVLDVPSSGIVSPYELAFALADDAAVNGVEFRFNESFECVSTENGNFVVKTTQNEYVCRVLINCAGASSSLIHNALTGDSLKIIHRRGQYYLLDRTASTVFSRTIFQCPSAMGKGVLVSPTVHGNLLLGPTAEDIDDPLDTSTTRDGLDDILKKAVKTWPALSTRSNITNFSGVRAHLETDDFVVGPVTGCPGAFEAVGIESPGLSSAPAIGLDLSRQVVDYLQAEKKTSLKPYPKLPKPFHEMNDEERAAAWRDNPDYGTVICRCEVVTEAEIRAAIRRPVGARTIDGVKRRTRAGMGRCQGGFCLPRVAAILSEELNIGLLDIMKDNQGSYILDSTIDSAAERKA
jgi:glycerol-3-phosphate dehydrogenase